MQNRSKNLKKLCLRNFGDFGLFCFFTIIFLSIFFLGQHGFCENIVVEKQQNLYKVYQHKRLDNRIIKLNTFALGKIESIKKKPDQTPYEFKINSFHPLEDELYFNLNRLGKEITSLYKYNGISIRPKDIILADDLDDIDLLEEEVQRELKREARNYLKEKYLTKVIMFKESLKLKLSVDSDNEIIDFQNKSILTQNPVKILHSIDSVIDRTIGISKDLKYSLGFRVHSSSIIEGDIIEGIEPVLKFKYKTMEMRTKFKPANNIYEFELKGKIPLKATKGKLSYSISTENLNNADWNINYSLKEGSFFYFGGDIPFAQRDHDGDELKRSMMAGFYLTF